MESINIQYHVLLEALLGRKIVHVNWMEQIQPIRDAIAILYAEIPKKLQHKSSHENLTYFDCKYILECLQSTPAGAMKNMFGQYTSPSVKKWMAIVRAYEKNNLFAAETARILTHNTHFEIPFMKKRIQQNEKQVMDNRRKNIELNNRILEYNRKLESACSELGISMESCKFEEELHRVSLEVPTMLAHVALTLVGGSDSNLESDADWIQQAIRYHEAIQHNLHHFDSEEIKKINRSLPVDSLEDVVDSPYFFSALQQLRAASDSVVVEETTMESTFQVDVNWGISTTESGEDGVMGVGIDVPVAFDWESPMEKVRGSITTPTCATRANLLLDPQFRSRLQNDLWELDVFLRHRQQELSDNNHLVFTHFQVTEYEHEAKIAQYQQSVKRGITAITNKRVQQLILIHSSERYLSRLVTSLEMVVKHRDKCQREKQKSEDQNNDLIETNKQLYIQLQSMISETKLMKTQLEGALHPLFKGHKLNIIGKINNL